MSERKLWSFNWKGGGYNQVYATSREDALDKVDEKFGKDSSWNRNRVDLKTLCEVHDEEQFWKNYPMFD